MWKSTFQAHVHISTSKRLSKPQKAIIAFCCNWAFVHHTFHMKTCLCFSFLLSPLFSGFSDINECEDKLHNCSDAANCVDMTGTYRCECLPWDTKEMDELAWVGVWRPMARSQMSWTLCYEIWLLGICLQTLFSYSTISYLSHFEYIMFVEGVFFIYWKLQLEMVHSRMRPILIWRTFANICKKSKQTLR